MLSDSVLVPIDPSLPLQSIADILQRVTPAAVLVQGDDLTSKLQSAIECNQNVSVPQMFNLDSTLANVPELPSGAAEVSAVKDLFASFEVRQVPTDALAAILYTSGSTGTPKGSMFTESHLITLESAVTVDPFIRLDFQSFDPTYILSLLSTMSCGGSRVFSRSLSHLMDDIGIARPTHIGAAPSFWTALMHRFHEEVQRRVQSAVAGAGLCELFAFKIV